ncbi:MAG TPA: ankyrin repeat domain-containing protein, partial [Burkholderiaceae bacterium]|nr:ankyrin repeat domain-containing protein [Burkholderiaceae bacterium]
MRNRTRPTSDAAARALPGTAWIAALCCAAAFAAGCATPDAPASPRSSEALRAMLAKGDLAGADALLASNPGAIDARRALDLAIRSGRVDATKHFLPRAGVDTPLDPDGTTPLIRAVLDAPPTERGRLVALLLEAGAQPDLVDRYGRSAREYATTRNRGELFEPPRDPSGLPAFAAWFGASPALPRAAAPAARPAGRDAAGRPATAAEARA